MSSWQKDKNVNKVIKKQNNYILYPIFVFAEYSPDELLYAFTVWQSLMKIPTT